MEFHVNRTAEQVNALIHFIGCIGTLPDSPGMWLLANVETREFYSAPQTISYQCHYRFRPIDTDRFDPNREGLLPWRIADFRPLFDPARS